MKTNNCFKRGHSIALLAMMLLLAVSRLSFAQSASSLTDSLVKSPSRPYAPVKDYIIQNRDQVLKATTFELYKCHKADLPDTLAFYLVGEVHLYNKETSFFAQHMISELNIGLFISEGLDPSNRPGEPELLYSKAIRSFEGEYDYDYPELYRLCKAKGIPVAFLEKLDSTGVREGVSAQDKTILSMMPELMAISGGMMNAFLKSSAQLNADTAAGSDSLAVFNAFLAGFSSVPHPDSAEALSASNYFGKLYSMIMHRVSSDTAKGFGAMISFTQDSAFMKSMSDLATQTLSDTTNPFVKRMREAQKDSSKANKSFPYIGSQLSDSTLKALTDALSKESDYMGLHARDSIMAEKSMEYLVAPPLVIKLVRVGAGHLDGILNFYKTKYSCDCESVPLEKILESAH